MSQPSHATANHEARRPARRREVVPGPTCIDQKLDRRVWCDACLVADAVHFVRAVRNPRPRRPSRTQFDPFNVDILRRFR